MFFFRFRTNKKKIENHSLTLNFNKMIIMAKKKIPVFLCWSSLKHLHNWHFLTHFLCIFSYTTNIIYRHHVTRLIFMLLSVISCSSLHSLTEFTQRQRSKEKRWIMCVWLKINISYCKVKNKKSRFIQSQTCREYHLCTQ